MGVSDLRLAQGSFADRSLLRSVSGEGPEPSSEKGHELTNPQLLQRFSPVERVTGIEPALSAWELLELLGMCLLRHGFRGHERPGPAPGCLP